MAMSDYYKSTPLYGGTASDPLGQLAILVKETAGVKHDEGKLRYDLISPTSLEGLAEVLTFGSTKYGDNNWMLGMKWGRVFGAAMRHLWAWWAKKGSDPETGFSHLKHALCCIHFLVHYESHGTGTDDRP